MANQRIKDIPDTATSAAADDYLVIDGATNGTRNILVSKVGGETEYDFASSLTPSIDSRGVSAGSYNITPSSSGSLTVANAMKIKGYLAYSSSVIYPLIATYVSVGSTNFIVQFKSISGNPQNTSSTTVSGTLHIIAPFEISSVAAGM